MKPRRKIEPIPEGSAAGTSPIFADIIELRQAEQALQRTNRTLRVLSLSNKILVRAADETGLLQQVCQIIVESGGYRLARVGFAEQEPKKTVRLVAQAGQNGGYLEKAAVTWDEGEFGRGPTGTAIRTGKPALCQDVMTDPGYKPWREEARRLGYLSSVALPLISDGHTLGALNVCAAEQDAFDSDEVSVLTELANDLAYGIGAIRTRLKHEQAVKALEESERKYSTLVERGNDGIVVIQDEKLRFANSMMVGLTGFNRDEVLGKPFIDFVAPEYRELVLQKYRNRVAGKEAEDKYEIELVGKDGRRRAVEINANGIEYQGRPADMAIVRDITARKRAEKAMRASEERYRTTLDGMLEGCQIISFNWRYLYVNDAACVHGRRAKEDLLGHTMMEMYPGIERTEMFARLRRCLENRTSHRMENEFTYPDGSKGWFELSIEPVPEGAFVLSLDITELKKAEMETQISQSFLEISNRHHDPTALLGEFVEEIKRLTHFEAVGIRILDESGNIPYKAYSGFSREFYEKESPLSLECDQCTCINVIKGTTDPNLPFYSEHGSFITNGTTRFLATVSEADKGKTRNVCNAMGYESVALIPIRSETGILGLVHLADRKENMIPPETVRLLERVCSVLGAGIQRVLAEEKIRELSSAVEQSPAIVMVTDAKGRIEYVNPKFSQITGYSSREVIGVNASELGDPPPEYVCKMWDALNSGREWRGEFPNKKKTGELYWEAASVAPLKDAQGKVTHFIKVAEDVTERKLTEDALRESEERFRTILDSAVDGVLVTDIETRRLFTANKAMCRMLGYSLDEIRNLSVMDVHPEKDLLYVLKQFEKQSSGEFSLARDIPLKRRDGSVFYAEVNPSLVTFAGKKYLAGIFRDVTERRQAEKEIEAGYQKLGRTLQGTIEAIGKMSEMKDPYTSGHQKRVSQIACAMGEEMGLSEETINGLRVAGLLHDVGKIQVPSEILSKPSHLNDNESEMVRSHVESSYQILKAVEFPWPVAEIVAQHHERMDGSGYPRGLSGEEILIEARILAVADVIEAMASHRPYRPALGIDMALEEISQNSGKLYDPGAVEACLKIFKKGFKIAE